MTNKLGVAYNLFDGEENLLTSIKSIKKNVNYICIVVQEVSNFGQTNKNIINVCKKLFKDNFIDQYYIYHPEINIDPHINETKKRNIGLDLCRKQNCTHFMTMDADEIYIPQQFEKAKQKVYATNLDAAVCQMVTYYKQGDYIIDPPENYFVPFIYKISPDKNFKYAIHFPVLIDPTRRINSQTVGTFKREDFLMHHVSYIRNNIRDKFLNSSSRISMNKNIDILVDKYMNWNINKKACIVDGYNVSYRSIKQVDDIFKTIEQIYND